MGRTLKFDYGQALDRATRLFWKHGYAGTSLRALLEAMEIGEGSFYNTLKSKKCLYIACLEHYGDTVGRAKGAALWSAPTAALGVRALFLAVLDALDDPESPRICMLAGSVSGDVLAEPGLGDFVRERMARVVDDLARRLAADKDAGRLPPDFDPEAVAAIITTYMQGLYQSTLISHDRPRVERQVDVFLTGLGL